jgi:hypothetical protein
VAGRTDLCHLVAPEFTSAEPTEGNLVLEGAYLCGCHVGHSKSLEISVTLYQFTHKENKEIFITLFLFVAMNPRPPAN